MISFSCLLKAQHLQSLPFFFNLLIRITLLCQQSAIFLQSLFWRRSFHYYRFAIFKKPAVAAWDELPGQIRAIIHISKIFLQFFIHNPAPLTDSPLPIILFKVKKYLTSKENRRLALLVRCSKYEVSILRCSLYRADLIHLSYFP